MTATIHLIHGFIGFGKTTIAKQLAHELPAVILTNDDFMVRLYGRNPPADMFQSYYNRVDDLIWDLAEKIIKAGTDVIIDHGFWTKESRGVAHNRAKEITDNVVFHNIQCDIDTARQSVLERTKRNRSELTIDENAFDLFYPQFQPISSDENYEIINHDNNLKEWNYAVYILPVREIDGKKQVALSVYKTEWYCAIGGRKDGNESPRETAIREMIEELGDSARSVMDNAMEFSKKNICKIRDIWFRRAKNEEHTYFIARVSADTELSFCEKDNPGFEIEWLDVDALGDANIIKLDEVREYYIEHIIPAIKSDSF
ncbi:MAG: AAA family ATPase [Alphaproteobacteria bacterium]|nr:AAA family ATPase [Alphaproteobacteria bacterium]